MSCLGVHFGLTDEDAKTLLLKKTPPGSVPTKLHQLACGKAAICHHNELIYGYMVVGTDLHTFRRFAQACVQQA